MAIEDLLLKACSEEAVPEVITKSYSRYVNIKKLEHQLNMIPDLIQIYKTTQQLNHLEITSI